MTLGNGVISELSRGRAGNKNRPHDRWLFVSGSGKLEGHFLRKLKTHALRAGLNCGRCKSTETKGGYDHKREVEVTCKTDDISGKWKLHRFLKVLGIGSIQKKIVLGVIAPAGRSEASIPYQRWFQGRKHVP